ncbi:sensor histidine kinase [Plantactinospora sp. B6F1]|uniref:sensor histidine kinase n=1 Tax=Plantactinospora sp. B6F1 TaxID=3158971 RepID=UPI0032D95A5F
MPRWRMPRWRWRGRAADAVLVLVVAVVGLVGLVVQSAGVDTPAEWVALLAVLVSSAALYVRRRHPVPVGVLALCAVGGYGLLLHRPGPIMLVFVVALYTVVDEGYLAVAIGLGLASVVAFAVADGSGRAAGGGNGATLLHAGWLVAVIVGVTRNRRAYLAEARARVLAAEQGREEEARRRATEERLRIARELHDVLGHHLSLINVQASAALHRPDPVRSAEALVAVKQASKEMLGELRTALGVLRQEGGPGLGRLGDLVLTAGRSGVEVRTEVAGIGVLPAEVDLAAYRIVQEALTNVTRHAGARVAVVRVRSDGGCVVVEVEDDGCGVPGVPGNGILGMGERARALGGSLTAGPGPGGGFRVCARLPSRSGPVSAGLRSGVPAVPGSGSVGRGESGGAE